jgi:hypothetical protein
VPDFDRVIPPGGEGKIKLTIRTKGYQGNIHKSARVYTNDRANSVIRLSVKGFVKVPILVSPRQIRLYGKEGQTLTGAVEVRAELDRPLTLTPSQYDLTEKVAYSIEETEKGKGFKIHFTTIASSPQVYRGVLKLKTNYPEKPEVTVWIKVRIQKKAKKPNQTDEPVLRKNET